MSNESGDGLRVELAMIDELALQLESLQAAFSETAGRLAKPSREDLEAMRDLRQAVTPEAFLLARLHLAELAVENAWSWLESIDAACFVALDEAFDRGAFPVDLVRFEDLARGAEQEQLVSREALERALDVEEADAARRSRQGGEPG
jgi:hypothetical protein